MAETTKETAIAAHTPAMLAKYAPFGVIASTARIEPGDAGETSPPPRIVSVNTPVIPPRITARGAEVGPKGMAVRHLKWYASWV
ncbi:hypothetical protein BFQ08_25540 [Escherichia coli]|nr:hypothetical protein BFQ08_25540 [Escherichia coli]